MKIQIYLLLALTVFLSSSTYAQYDSIPFDGYNRTYLLHLPPSYSGTTDLPLVIAMHGGFGSALNLQNQSQLSQKADAENFIVVYPEGVEGLLNIRTWNAGTCCGSASANDINDVGFIDSLVNILVRDYAIDANRIYATGMSNGGFMAYRLACELSGKIAAIAPVACSMTAPDCHPENPVPIIHFHSYLDFNIPYSGGVGEGVSSHYNPPLDSVLEVWSSFNNCMSINDTLVHNEQFTFRKWTNCSCQAEIQYYISQDGGHSWPGGNQTIVGGPVSEYINASDLMWDFFQQHSLDCNPVSAEEIPSGKYHFEVFPNPAGHFLFVLTENLYAYIELEVYNLNGQKLLSAYNQTEINLTHFPKGAYFLKIKTDKSTEIHKFIK